tara:strand:- start:2789 stop:5074 length:2286 start_codon:yes stop_codon:yes gene_type:complete
METKDILKGISKNKLKKCIILTADQLGLTTGEFINYSEKRLKTNKEEYSSVYPKVPDITITGDKTYITNLKVMLAQNLYVGKKMIKLNDKLSNILQIKEPPIGWYISEKYDGIRAIWDGEKFISRGQKVFTYVPDFFIELMPPGVALDGEIWIGRNLFGEVSRLSTLKIGKSKSKKEIDKLWQGTNNQNSVKYMVYDVPNSNQPFEIRMNFLEQIVKDRNAVWESQENIFECPLKFTNQTKIETMEQLVNTYKELTSKGAEGVMLRAPNSPYETKRSKYLLKYKIKDDAEAIVRGYTMGTGKYKGLLGSLECNLIIDKKPSTIKFNIGTGFTDKDRTEYNNPKSTSYIPIGSIVSFSYMELTPDSVPRHPVYRGIRDDFTINEEKEKEKLKEIEPEDQNYKSIIIDNFNILIKNEETQKEANWQFKRKAYKQTIDILSASHEIIDSVKKTLEVLRAGGAKLDGEEAYFIKNGEYKSKTLQKISEIIKTGILSKAIDISDDPKVKAITELTKIPEIGPSKADKLYALDIKTIADLTEAFKKDNTLLNSKQAIGLKYYTDLDKRIPREEMDEWNEFFNKILRFTIERNASRINIEGAKLELVGSYRRGALSSGDIDILLTSKNSLEGKKLMALFIKELLKTEYLDSTLVFSSGNTKFMGLGKIKDYYRHIDIFYYSEKEYPFALLFSTGSGQFNIEMRADAIKKGYSLSEKELTYRDSSKISEEEYLSDINKKYPTTEKDIFDFLGLTYIEPKDRQSGAIINK